jgi:hypothetical protein
MTRTESMDGQRGLGAVGHGRVGVGPVGFGPFGLRPAGLGSAIIERWGARAGAAAAIAASVVMLAGCAKPGTTRRDAPRPIGPSDFVARPGEAPVRRPDGALRGPNALALQPTDAGMNEDPFAVGGETSVRTVVVGSGGGAPERPGGVSGAEPARAGDAAWTGSGAASLVDAKVGDINGRPIYAREFLEPLAARLAAEAERTEAGPWRRLAEQEISRRLDGLITDELLKAEALSTLNEEQQAGLRSFLQGVRTRLVSENLGSARLAEQRLLEAEGKNLEDRLREEEETTLVRLALAEDVYRRVNVSWRDVKLRYERDAGKYNPPPTAVFRLIRVPRSDAAARASVESRLAAGEAFSEVASDEEVNRFKPDEGGQELVAFEGEFSEGEFFGAEALNEAAQGLTLGGRVGPVEFGSQVGWLTLEEIRRESVSLYDAQLAIQQELTLERREAELRRYVGRLLDRAGAGERDAMRARLVSIASRWYGPAGAAEFDAPDAADAQTASEGDASAGG